MPTETKLRKPFIEALRRCGAKVIPYVGSTMGQQGTADVFVAHKIWHGWIEFKGPNTPLTRLQEIFLSDMRKRNVNAHCIRLLDTYRFRVDEELAYNWQTGDEICTILALIAASKASEPTCASS